MTNKLLDMVYCQMPEQLIRFYKGKILKCPRCANTVLLNSIERLLSNGVRKKQYRCQQCSLTFYAGAKHRKPKKQLVYY